MEKEIIIFDIDGTLADIAHRRHYVAAPVKDWDNFHKNAQYDTLIEKMGGLYRALWQSGMYEIIVMTGREEYQREMTKQWFKCHDLPLGALLMRPDGSRIQDAILKKSWIDELRLNGRSIAFAVDDRQRVVDMFREHDVLCLQCDVGNF